MPFRRAKRRQIKTLRENAHASQAVFAAVRNTSVSTVQKWETGDKKPSGPSLKLLNLIERKGLQAVIWFRGVYARPGALHSVGKQHVEVGVEVERTAEAPDQGDRAGQGRAKSQGLRTAMPAQGGRGSGLEKVRT